MTDRLPVHHFSDVLCIWAYAADARFRRLEAELADEIDLTWHFIPVYADIHRRIAESGLGYDGYSAKIRGVADRFDHLEVHPELFRTVVPQSSLPAHLFLHAVGLLQARDELPGGTVDGAHERLTRAVRDAWFRDLRDVSQRDVLYALAEAEGCPVAPIEAAIASGEAWAVFGRDLLLQREHDVRVSPTVVLDDGRQHLNGNVSFGVIAANVRELIAQRGVPAGSVC